METVIDLEDMLQTETLVETIMVWVTETLVPKIASSVMVETI